MAPSTYSTGHRQPQPYTPLKPLRPLSSPCPCPPRCPMASPSPTGQERWRIRRIARQRRRRRKTTMPEPGRSRPDYTPCHHADTRQKRQPTPPPPPAHRKPPPHTTPRKPHEVPHRRLTACTTTASRTSEHPRTRCLAPVAAHRWGRRLRRQGSGAETQARLRRGSGEAQS